MEDLTENLGKWLKRNKPKEQMDTPTDTTKREKQWFSKGEGQVDQIVFLQRKPLGSCMPKM